jgi:hypothetical protein
MRMKARPWFALGIALLLGAPLAACTKTAAQPVPRALPERLSGTGLFADSSMTQTRPGVIAFSPQYPLWSDGATKRRWIKLPEGKFIDASRPDAWEFPPGTRLWKQFSVGRPVETRLIERQEDGSWRFATYIWTEDGTDATLAPEEGVPSLKMSGGSGHGYTIPSEADCRACHDGAAVPVLGFSALQLSPDRDPLAPHGEAARPDHVNLRTLAERGLLRNLPKSLIDNPPKIAASSPTERAALGYLHGNCAHCHNESSDGAGVPVVAKLEQKVADGGSAAFVLGTLIGETSRFRGPGSHAPAQLVSPGHSDLSVLVKRMRSRDARVQMPPLGTQVPDEEALALIERWIDRELKH